MRTINVLNLGAGVQSTALYLLFHEGKLPWKLDYAVFADTQEEPADVYKHLDWLKSLGGAPILMGTRGKLGEHLKHGANFRGGRFAAIPAFTTADGGTTVGKTRRQCTKDYKTDIIGQVIRREILGLAPGRTPKRNVHVNSFIGISLDEAGRAKRMERNVPAPKYLTRFFPLIDMNWTRAACRQYLEDRVPHRTPRSACVFCPFHNDYEWHLLKTEKPEEFARAVEIDHALRTTGSVANRDMRQTMYIHRSCKPLELVQFDASPPKPKEVNMAFNFNEECEGMCGL